MRFRTALSLATQFVVCFTRTSWATPVEYRSADGKNIAVHVVVASASAFRTR